MMSSSSAKIAASLSTPKDSLDTLVKVKANLQICKDEWNTLVRAGYDLEDKIGTLESEIAEGAMTSDEKDQANLEIKKYKNQLNEINKEIESVKEPKLGKMAELQKQEDALRKQVTGRSCSDSPWLISSLPSSNNSPASSRSSSESESSPPPSP